MRYFILFCALVSCASGYFLADPHDYHWEPYAGGRHQSGVDSPSYDTRGLNDLVERLRTKSSVSSKQAKALADVWHITEADLTSNVDIFGEKRK